MPFARQAARNGQTTGRLLDVSGQHLDVLMTKASPLIALMRASGPSLLVELGVNFAAPWAVYHYSAPRLGEVGALMASSGPPILWSLATFIRSRRIDAISAMVIVGIVLSLLAYIGANDAKLLQLREKMVTGLIGVAFIGSAAMGKPLIYWLARAGVERQGADALAEFDSSKTVPLFRRTMTILTLVWGLGLLTDAGLGALLVRLLSVSDYLLVGPLLGYAVTGALILWTVLFTRHQQSIGRARRAAARAGAASDISTEAG